MDLRNNQQGDMYIGAPFALEVLTMKKTGIYIVAFLVVALFLSACGMNYNTTTDITVTSNTTDNESAALIEQATDIESIDPDLSPSTEEEEYQDIV